jgi:hypothetical protein
MASSSQLEQRVANLEAEVATLKRKLDKLDRTTPWWEQIAGTFENDPIYEKEYCLSNHTQGENLGYVSIHPEAGKQGHGEVNHFFRSGNNDRASLEASEPMPLPTMVPLNPVGLGFAHDQFLGRDYRRVGFPMVGVIQRDLPLVQAINQLLQGCRITTPALPVQEAACITITSLPDPEFAPFFLRKCHISSSSRTTAFPLGAGFSACSAAYWRIQVRIVLAHTPNIFAKAFIETP